MATSNLFLRWDRAWQWFSISSHQEGVRCEISLRHISSTHNWFWGRWHVLGVYQMPGTVKAPYVCWRIYTPQFNGAAAGILPFCTWGSSRGSGFFTAGGWTCAAPEPLSTFTLSRVLRSFGRWNPRLLPNLHWDSQRSCAPWISAQMCFQCKVRNPGSKREPMHTTQNQHESWRPRDLSNC